MNLEDFPGMGWGGQDKVRGGQLMRDEAVRASEGFRDFPKRPHSDNNRAQIQPQLSPSPQCLEDQGPFPCRPLGQPR